MEYEILDRDRDGEDFRTASSCNFSPLKSDYTVKAYNLILPPFSGESILKEFSNFVIDHIWVDEGLSYLIPSSTYGYDRRSKVQTYKAKLFDLNARPEFADKFDLNARLITYEHDNDDNYSSIAKFEFGHITTKEPLSEFIMMNESSYYYSASLLLKGVPEDKVNSNFLKKIFGTKYLDILNSVYMDEIFIPGITTIYVVDGDINRGFLGVTEISRKQ